MKKLMICDSVNSIIKKNNSYEQKEKELSSLLQKAFFMIFPPLILVAFPVSSWLYFGFLSSLVLIIESCFLCSIVKDLVRQGYINAKKCGIPFLITIPLYGYMLVRLYTHGNNDIVFHLLNGVCYANITAYIGKQYKSKKKPN